MADRWECTDAEDETDRDELLAAGWEPYAVTMEERESLNERYHTICTWVRVWHLRRRAPADGGEA